LLRVANEQVGTADVAKMLGISRQRVHQLRAQWSDFPSPTVEHPRAAFWRVRDIERWGRKHGYIDKEG
jgi:predicted DNA-binding transcriptional regulator AlpA